jgi:protein phosphatase
MTKAYDIIGDVHGCINELNELLTLMGYYVGGELGREEGGYWKHPEGRQVVWVGDLCDRGPGNVQVLKTVMATVAEGHGLCVLGNHDDKLHRYLKGNNIKIGNGLDVTIKELEAASWTFRADVKEFLEERPIFLKLDEGRLLVSHAGLREDLQDLVDPNRKKRDKIRSKCLYGETTGRTLDNGFPERLDWASDYHGERVVVHGHTAKKEPYIKNKVYCVDTGAVFGGRLTALRYPEMELVSVPSEKYDDNESLT